MTMVIRPHSYRDPRSINKGLILFVKKQDGVQRLKICDVPLHHILSFNSCSGIWVRVYKTRVACVVLSDLSEK